jgi:oxygen-dependent protoporphyrinogen oxidase
MAPNAARALSNIEYVSTVTVTLAFPDKRIPRLPLGHGYVIPRIEGRPSLACTWVSRKFAGRAPAGHTLFRVFIGRAGEPDPTARSESDLVSIARDELASMLGIRGSPSFQRVFLWPRAMPQYNLGHLGRIASIQADLSERPGLFLAGALHGVGVPDCIASGEDAASAAAAYLSSEL